MTLPNSATHHVVMHGLAVGLDQLTNLLFDPKCPHTYCRICGAVFQSTHDRDSNSDSVYATVLRRQWSFRHAATHTEREHEELRLWGFWVLPEAAHKLAAFGIVPITDMVVNEEVSHALATSSPIPCDDAEGS